MAETEVIAFPHPPVGYVFVPQRSLEKKNSFFGAIHDHSQFYFLIAPHMDTQARQRLENELAGLGHYGIVSDKGVHLFRVIALSSGH